MAAAGYTSLTVFPCDKHWAQLLLMIAQQLCPEKHQHSIKKSGAVFLMAHILNKHILQCAVNHRIFPGMKDQIVPLRLYVQYMRKETGQSIVIRQWLKEGGLTFPEVLEICQHLAELGFNGIEVTGNIHGKAEKMVGQEFDGYPLERDGYFLKYAEKVAEKVQIPVMLTGGNRDPQVMEKLLETSGVVMFGFSRPLLCEPNLVARWNHGDLATARCVPFHSIFLFYPYLR